MVIGREWNVEDLGKIILYMNNGIQTRALIFEVYTFHSTQHLEVIPDPEINPGYKAGITRKLYLPRNNELSSTSNLRNNGDWCFVN